MTLFQLEENPVAFLKNQILTKVKILLEQKHLYQTVNLDLPPQEKHVSSPRDLVSNTLGGFLEEKRKPDILKIITIFWSFKAESSPPDEDTGKEDFLFRFILPMIKISCIHCDAVNPPHNSGFKDLKFNLPEINFKKEPEKVVGFTPVQVFFMPYQCQSCRGEPIIFVVRREGLKLQIVGRSHFEEVNVPRYIPREESRYYKDAVISFNCGRTLAALFYLRVMIEQYLRRVLKEDGRVRGEDLADKYNKLLPDDFPRDRYKSLGNIFEDLSTKIHEADEDESQYNDSLKDINKHFDLLQHIPLIKPK